ncbi:MAG: DNA gyrase inhibitor YacG [Pararhodobacter sp.]
MAEPRCPICARPSVADYTPFCSRRCADVDLARWLRGDYAIPGPEAEAAEELPTRPDQD